MATIAVVTDLIFSTKITGTGKALGKPVLVARTLEKLEEHLGASTDGVPLVIVDLNSSGLDTVEAVPRESQGSAGRGVFVTCGSGVGASGPRGGGGSGDGAERLRGSFAGVVERVRNEHGGSQRAGLLLKRTYQSEFYLMRSPRR